MLIVFFEEYHKLNNIIKSIKAKLVNEDLVDLKMELTKKEQELDDLTKRNLAGLNKYIMENIEKEFSPFVKTKGTDALYNSINTIEKMKKTDFLDKYGQLINEITIKKSNGLLNEEEYRTLGFALTIIRNYYLNQLSD